MNAKSTNNESSGVLIDQLVANELCETKRAELIQWLEESRERWRDLGLAFLEAQIWRSSIALLERESGPTRLPLKLATPAASIESDSYNRLGLGIVLAASLLFTFLGGVKWAEYTSVSRSKRGQMAHLNSNELTRRPAAAINADVGTTLEEHSQVGATHSSIEINAYARNSMGAIEKIKVPMAAARSTKRLSDGSEKIKRSLEDRGFAVRTEQRYLPATLPDGRKVMLPFDQLLASYVGKAVY